jgi:tRNA1Val (adenine37-N6)-methyltransferase
MSSFHFKYFSIKQDDTAMKVGTDAMLLGSFVDVRLKNRALDVGSGTGVLACMLAQQKSDLVVDAIEIEENAFRELVHNANNASFSKQIKPILGDLLVYKPICKYDLIVSNPPYFEDTFLSEDNTRNLARHVLDLTPLKLLKFCSEFLTDNGDCWFIIPHTLVSKWQFYAENVGLYFTAEYQIMGVPGKHVRSILRFSRYAVPIVREVFVIRTEAGNYTNEYILKTSEFHFKSPIR